MTSFLSRILPRRDTIHARDMLLAQNLTKTLEPFYSDTELQAVASLFYDMVHAHNQQERREENGHDARQR